MHILLINDNPLVSQLLLLCTRNENMVLEETTSVAKMKRNSYDVVFIDERSYTEEILNLSTIISIGKKVLLSNTDIERNDFDTILRKPFLPSQIKEILDRKKQDSTHDLKTKVLDKQEIETIKNLLEIDENVVDTKVLNEDDHQALKLKVIKEKLIADGLEIIEEDEIIDIFNKKTKQQTKKQTKKQKENKKIKHTFLNAFKKLTKKQKKRLLKGKEIEVSIKLEDND